MLWQLLAQDVQYIGENSSYNVPNKDEVLRIPSYNTLEFSISSLRSAASYSAMKLSIQLWVIIAPTSEPTFARRIPERTQSQCFLR